MSALPNCTAELSRGVIRLSLCALDIPEARAFAERTTGSSSCQSSPRLECRSVGIRIRPRTRFRQESIKWMLTPGLRDS